MPRIGRLFIPGGCFHLIGRGLERRCIFRNHVDKRDFLARIGEHLQRTDYQCLAWALMSNHYHFLVRAGTSSLKTPMAPVLGGFAGAYNRRCGRSGYVFQNRYTSILCDEDNYLLDLTRYIHLNTVRAGFVDTLDALGQYHWTGHAGLLGRYRQPWHQTDLILAHFGAKRNEAVRSYSALVQEGVDNSGSVHLSGGGVIRSYGGWKEMKRTRQEHKLRIGDERILGSSNFVNKVLQEDSIKVKLKSKLARDGWDLEKLIQKICDLLDIHPDDLLMKSRKSDASRAKAMICYWGTNKLGLKAGDIAKRLRISQPAVSKWVAKGRLQESGNSPFAELDE
jgi:putative transposase